MIRYLVSDLDGTLLKKGDIIDKSDIDAILKFINNGNHFFVASGRGVSYIDELDKKGVRAEYMFGSTGSVLAGENITKVLSYITKYKALEMMDYLDEIEGLDYALDIFPHNGKHFVKAKYGTYYNHNASNRFNKILSPKSFYDNDNGTLLKFFVICKDDELAYKVKDYISDNFNDFKALHADYGCLEVVPKDTNKWHAIKYLIDELGIDKKELACIGDEENDMKMIKEAGIGFAMINASDEVKEVADHVVSSVKEAIEICMGE